MPWTQSRFKDAKGNVVQSSGNGDCGGNIYCGIWVDGLGAGLRIFGMERRNSVSVLSPMWSLLSVMRADLTQRCTTDGRAGSWVACEQVFAGAAVSAHEEL